ncbi:integral membrane protein [Cryptosporidium canis]|uniref:Transmembrane 9 superfamily member n=1 Tax=Cryptosporidium canis TaxID=195482 RepID=A0ABQ8P228_9CRYT|nr:integral membrane protein [Cryptosporidium canis]KAJ1607724.1 integral membrane protein [Cryptosporidium canis]
MGKELNTKLSGWGRRGLLALVLIQVLAVAHCYSYGDSVSIVMNRIWKYDENIMTSEFSFFSKVPLCHDNRKIGEMSFNEIVRGDQLKIVRATFGLSEANRSFCSVNLTKEQLYSIRYHIRNNYVFEIYVEDKAIAKTLGYINENNEAILITGYNFVIGYRDKDIVSLDVNTRREQMINIDKTLELNRQGRLSQINMYYSVEWVDRSHEPLVPHHLDHFDAFADIHADPPVGVFKVLPGGRGRPEPRI